MRSRVGHDRLFETKVVLASRGLATELYLDLGLHLLKQLRQLLLVALLHRPLHTKTFLGIWLRNYVYVNMIHFLMCQATIVLQNVVLLCTGRARNLGCYREDLRKRIVGNIGQCAAMMLRDDELVYVSDATFWSDHV